MCGKYFPPTSAEIHAFGWGLMDGARIRNKGYQRAIADALKYSDDVKKESHYYRAGYFLTNRVKWGVVGYMAGGCALWLPM